MSTLIFIINCVLLGTFLLIAILNAIGKATMQAIKLCKEGSVDIIVGIPEHEEYPKFFRSRSEILLSDEDRSPIYKKIFVNVNLLYSLIFELSNIELAVEHKTADLTWNQRSDKMTQLAKKISKGLNVFERIIFSFYCIVEKI